MKNENEHSVWLLWMEGIMKRQGVLSRRGARLSAWTVALTALVVVVLALPLSRQMLAQTTTGSITGTLLDTQGAVVPGATVTAVNVNRNSTSTTTTDAQGHFVFAMLLPGHYTVAAEARGFKKLERQDLVVETETPLSLGELRLEVGEMTTTVTVVAQGQLLQTDTAQRGDTVTGNQLDNIQVNGQTPLSLLRLVPGVLFPTTQEETTIGFGDVYINGSQDYMAHYTVNGGQNMDTGGNSSFMAPVSLDTVQEFKVLTSTFNAEYSRSAEVSLVTKSGTSNFHGMGYEYYRDKGMNANSWTNNRAGLPVGDYHYNDFGFNLGGPIYIPGKFNTDKSKLFFFWDEVWDRQLVPASAKYFASSDGTVHATVPTALERKGDFSQSHDSSGNPVLIRDPQLNLPCNSSNTSGCFPGNVIPPSMQYQPGMALLNILPLPNETSAANPSYNYISEVSISRPRREDVVRVDSNLTPKWRLLGSLVRTKDAEVGPYGIWGDTNIPLYKEAYTIPGYHYLLNLTTTISPTAINEITVDMANDSQFAGSVAGTWTIANTKVAMPTLYSPVGDRIAGFTFGGTKIGNSASGNWPPFQNANTTRELIDNFSKSQGQHTLKLGMVYMHNWKVQPVGGDYNGNYNYGDNGANPLDSGFGFSNAALGVFSSFDQGSRYFDGYPLWNQWEWYAQDTWKVRSRLTLNYGVRFMYLQPVFNGHSTTANFFPQDFVPAIAPQLIEPTLVSGQRTGINPATGLTYPSVDIGAIVPGTGDSLNGLKILGQGGLSKYITKSPGIIPAPRLGFTLDLTGHQNIVLHAGGGMFVDRTQTDAQNAPTANPPNTYNPVVNYGYASQLSLGTGVLSPSSLSAMSYNTPIDHIYNYSIGVESRLPKAMRLDVSYEGGVFNHLPKSYNINAVPFGADFLPQNQDPTLVAANPNALLGSNAMLPQFLRPYVGYGAITMADFGANSNYNSLQVELNRRFATGVFFGAAYTWSKCMNMVDNTNGASVRWDQYSHQALYGPCSWNPTQNLVINYVYQLPKIPSGSSFNNRGSRAILNDWQLSGLTVFTGGLPYSPSFSVSGVSGQNITGTPDWAPDLLCVGNPRAGTTSSPYNRINAAAFAVPPVGSIGLGCARNDLWGPGVNNWDMSLQKNVRLTEHAQIQLRVEAFNVFNHTQFNGVNSGISYSSLTNPVPTNLPYNSAGQLVNINGFGTVSSVLDPRVLQLVAKFVF